MKRSLSLLLILSLLCALLAGCAGTACPPASGGGDQEPLPKTEGAVARCRVVAVSEGNTLLLADVDSERGDIYTLDAGELPLYREPTERGELLADSQLAAGALVEVAFGGDILESYPALFGGVERITVLPDEFDDRCALYLRVLGDLWGKDTGLNGGADYISVDLAATSLTPAERSAVAWTFAQSHRLPTTPTALICCSSVKQGIRRGWIFPTPILTPCPWRRRCSLACITINWIPSTNIWKSSPLTTTAPWMTPWRWPASLRLCSPI